MIELLTDKEFWTGVVALAAILGPIVGKHTHSNMKAKKELAELLKTSKEDDESIRTRAKAYAKKALNKYME